MVFSTQTALVWLIEKGKHQLGKNGFAGALLMDLSMAFHTINYDLVIAKFYAYGFGKNGLDLVHSFLKNRNQRMKVNTTLNTWTDLIGLYHRDQYYNILPNIFGIYLVS